MCGARPLRHSLLAVAPSDSKIICVTLAVCLEFLARPKMVCCGGGGGAGEAGAWSGRHPHQSVPARRTDRSPARLRLSPSPGGSMYKYTVSQSLTEQRCEAFYSVALYSLVDGSWHQTARRHMPKVDCLINVHSHKRRNVKFCCHIFTCGEYWVWERGVRRRLEKITYRRTS